MAAPKLPTPGRTTCVASSIIAASSASRARAPSRSSAARTDARFAVPVGTTITSGALTAPPWCSAPDPDPSSAHRLTQRQRRGLERRLGAVVVVGAAQHIDVQRHAPGGRKREKEVRHVLAGEVAERLALQTELDDRAGPAGQVDDRPRQRLVQRRVGRAEARDAAPFPERLIERLAERQRAVLDRVVIVDLEVALASQGQVEARVPGERAEHVIEEADAGCDLGLAAAVEAEVDLDRRLQGLAADRRAARAHPGFPPRHGTLRARSGRARSPRCRCRRAP